MRTLTLEKFNEVSKAKTKYDMCWYMDNFNYRNLPWVAMSSAFSKVEIRCEFDNFLQLLFSKVCNSPLLL